MKVMLMRENEQLVQNKKEKRKKNNQAKLDVYRHKTTVKKTWSVCMCFCLLCCTMDTVHDDICPTKCLIVT